MSARNNDTRAFETVEALVEAMQPFARLGIGPNVDLYAGLIYRQMGLPDDLAAAIFAAGRMPGWIAQVLEQRANNILIRPLLHYVGAPQPRLRADCPTVPRCWQRASCADASGSQELAQCPSDGRGLPLSALWFLPARSRAISAMACTRWRPGVLLYQQTGSVAAFGIVIVIEQAVTFLMQVVAGPLVDQRRSRGALPLWPSSRAAYRLRAEPDARRRARTCGSAVDAGDDACHPRRPYVPSGRQLSR